MPLISRLSVPALLGITLVLFPLVPAAAEYPGRGPIDAYLAEQTEAVEARCLTEPISAEAWTEQRPALELQLRDMLGLNPWPQRTDLNAKIVSRTEHDGYAVERIHFQSQPGLYVSANLYLPNVGKGPFPTILYVCGHANVKVDGVRYGNKVGYHHHGVWYARHGYVAMLIDTIQLGEIEGIHHGTYSKGMWWWPSRGYTPAGVEAWNSMRALDYLETRPEVDAQRFGVTGRSGGGAYSWWTAALDQRIKVAVPVAGITDMRNHIIDGCIEGHCDCMFMVNRFAWDFATVAAMVAPRPLLIANSHRDRIFPLDGVIRVYNKSEKVYDALGARDNIAVHITEGPHKDTQVLRAGAFAWFEKHLKKSTDELPIMAPKAHEPQELQVYVDGLPADQRVTDVQEWFVPQPETASQPTDQVEWAKLQAQWMQNLSDIPGATSNLQGFAFKSVKTTETQKVGEVEFRQLEIETTTPLRSFVIAAVPKSDQPVDSIKVCIGSPAQDGLEFSVDGQVVKYSNETESLIDRESIAMSLTGKNQAVLFLMLQGTGKSRWLETEKKTTHLRRRLHLLGQSIDGIGTSEIRSLLTSIADGIDGLPAADSVQLEAAGSAACMAALASLGSDNVSLVLHRLPDDLGDGPILLGLTKASDLTRILALVAANATLTIDSPTNESIGFVKSAAERLNWSVEIQ